MLFLAGPRQVGKTTIGLSSRDTVESFFYCNWDDIADRQMIMRGPQAVSEKLGINRPRNVLPIIVFASGNAYGSNNYLGKIFAISPKFKKSNDWNF